MISDKKGPTMLEIMIKKGSEVAAGVNRSKLELEFAGLKAKISSGINVTDKDRDRADFLAAELGKSPSR